MTYVDMPLIIPILATGYLVTIYLLLVLAQQNAKEPNSESFLAQRRCITRISHKIWKDEAIKGYNIVIASVSAF
jgi:hypothetical protein